MLSRDRITLTMCEESYEKLLQLGDAKCKFLTLCATNAKKREEEECAKAEEYNNDLNATKSELHKLKFELLTIPHSSRETPSTPIPDEQDGEEKNNNDSNNNQYDYDNVNNIREANKCTYKPTIVVSSVNIVPKRSPDNNNDKDDSTISASGTLSHDVTTDANAAAAATAAATAATAAATATTAAAAEATTAAAAAITTTTTTTAAATTAAAAAAQQLPPWIQHEFNKWRTKYLHHRRYHYRRS